MALCQSLGMRIDMAYVLQPCSRSSQEQVLNVYVFFPYYMAVVAQNKVIHFGNAAGRRVSTGKTP